MSNEIDPKAAEQPSGSFFDARDRSDLVPMPKGTVTGRWTLTTPAPFKDVPRKITGLNYVLQAAKAERITHDAVAAVIGADLAKIELRVLAQMVANEIDMPQEDVLKVVEVLDKIEITKEI